jgi:hypothetical protein
MKERWGCEDHEDRDDHVRAAAFYNEPGGRTYTATMYKSRNVRLFSRPSFRKVRSNPGLRLGVPGAP